VAVALDTSGSIRPAELERTRDLAVRLLASLPRGSEVAVITFDDQSRILVERTSEPDPVHDALLSVRPSGRFTALHDALYDASRYLRDAPPARKAILLLTDGRDENSALNLDDGLAVATSAGIPVFAIGIGRVEEKALRRIAKLSGGDYVAIAGTNTEDLAARIASLPTPTPPPPPPTLAAAGASAPPVPPPVASRWRNLLWLVFVGAVLAAGLLILLALSRRQAAPPSAPLLVAADGPELPTLPAPTSEAAEPAVDDDPAYSPTMLGPMPTAAGDYLDKTITLSELPMLVVQGGPQSGQFYVLTQKSTTCLGRAQANDIVLDDVSVSGQHCRVRFESGHFVVHDLKSTNGTFVNERRVTRHPLKPGDVLKLGETLVQFKLDRKKA